MKGSKLFKKANSENWLKIFNLQDWVGGRTSITSSVGLLPLALINENIFEFIRGASLMDEATRISDFKNNPAALLSSAWYLTGDGIGKYIFLIDFAGNILDSNVKECMGEIRKNCSIFKVLGNYLSYC